MTLSHPTTDAAAFTPNDTKPDGIRIVPAGVAHIDVLVPLHAQCFNPPWSKDAIVQSLMSPGSFALIAASGDQAEPVGFCLARASAGEAEILSLGVVPAARRSGIGRLLLAAMTARAATLRTAAVFLEVAESNASARALYLQVGFRQVGVRQNYYRSADGGSEHALILRRDLCA